MSNLVTHADDTLMPPWSHQEDTLGLAETATERVAQAFRLLTALQSTAEVSVDPLRQSSRMILLNEMTALLGEQLAAMRQKLIGEQLKSRSLEAILRQLAAPRRAA